MIARIPDLALVAPVIELRGVAKTYRQQIALQPVNLAVQRGECLALLGHNGAGKTTLLKLISGLTRPTQGQIELLGAPLGRNKHWRRHIGFMPENVTFQNPLSGFEVLQFYARLKGCSSTQCEQLLAQVGLAEAARHSIGTYSKGMRQRLLLAQALLGQPELLLLDEPTNGLDPAVRVEFYRLLREHLKAGASIVISSHALTELETKVDRVAILKNGALLACASAAELRQQTALPIILHVTLASAAAYSKVVACCQGRGTVHKRSACQLEISCSNADKMSLLRSLSALDEAIIDLDIESPSLDQIYTKLNQPIAAKPFGSAP